MTSKPDPAEPCLAQQALQTYDLLGEAPMLTLIRHSADPHPADFPRSNQALTVLKDHTAVLIASEHYVFLWRKTDSSGVFHPPRRQRTLKDRPTPESGNERPIFLAGAVTRTSILHEALKRIETGVRLALGHSETGSWLAHDPPVTEADIHAVAPTFLKELDLQAATGAESDLLYQFMDDTAHEIAEHVINASPEREIKALEQMLHSAITATNEDTK